MKLLFKQRFFSWFDSYDIYNEAGETVYTVEGKLSWGHCLHILDAAGNHIGTVKERVLTLLPKFELYENDVYIGLSLIHIYSKVKVLLIPTNEELMIAMDTASIVKG